MNGGNFAANRAYRYCRRRAIPHPNCADAGQPPMRAIDLRVLAGRQVRFSNELVRFGRAGGNCAGSICWQVVLRQPMQLANKIAFRVAVGDQFFCLSFSEIPNLSAVEQLAPVKQLRAAPDDIVIMVFESAYRPFWHLLQKVLGVAIDINEVCFDAEIEPLPLSCYFRLSWNDQHFDGELSCDYRVGELFIAAMRNSEYEPPAGRYADPSAPLAQSPFDAIGVDVAVVIASLRIRVAELKQLAIGDYLVSQAIASSLSTVRIGRQWYCLARFEAGRITVTTGVEIDMSDEQQSAELELKRPVPENVNGFSIDQLDLELSFGIGSKTVTLAELQAIGPGYVFEIGGELERLVELRVNRQRIGCGELVDVDQRIGVRVVELFGLGDGKSS